MTCINLFFFSVMTDVLCSPRRVKLIMTPFKVNDKLLLTDFDLKKLMALSTVDQKVLFPLST